MNANDAKLCRSFFDLLRISPSYELARQLEAGTLDPNTQIPPYFDDVLRTYQELGDVTRTRFHDWMATTFKRRIEDMTEHRPAALLVVHDGMGADMAALDGQLQDYLQGAAQHRQSADTVVLAVPLGVPREILRAQLEKLLNEQEAQQRAMFLEPHQYDEEYSRPKLWRERGKDLVFAGVDLLIQYAADQAAGRDSWMTGKALPDNQDITRGVQFSKGSSSDFHIGSVTWDDETIARKKLTKRVSEDVKKYRTVCENAARGYFVSGEELVNMPTFDFPAIHRRLEAIDAWEETDKPSRQPLDVLSLRPEHTMLTLYGEWLAGVQTWCIADE